MRRTRRFDPFEHIDRDPFEFDHIYGPPFETQEDHLRWVKLRAIHDAKEAAKQAREELKEFVQAFRDARAAKTP